MTGLVFEVHTFCPHEVLRDATEESLHYRQAPCELTVGGRLEARAEAAFSLPLSSLAICYFIVAVVVCLVGCLMFFFVHLFIHSRR